MPLASPHRNFWRWFARNADRLRDVMYGKDERARERASAEMREAVEEVEEGLVLEFGPALEGGTKTLIVSADGKPDRVDAVKDLVAAAPALEGWKVIAFRSRMDFGEGVSIRIGDEEIGPDDIWFKVAEDEDGLGLTLYVRGLNPENERVRGLGASLLAEHAVGERDALTLIRSLDFEALPDAPEAAGLRPFADLVPVFDAAKQRKFPPPGSLPIDPDQDWQGMRGTVNDSPAMMLLCAGLSMVAGHPAYDRRLTVSVRFNEVNDDGMPDSEEEYQAVSEIGDRFTDALTAGQESLLSMTLMTQGRRDLIFYTADADAALRRVREIEAGVQSHKVETDVERDTFWGMYRHFLRAGQEE